MLRSAATQQDTKVMDAAGHLTTTCDGALAMCVSLCQIGEHGALYFILWESDKLVLLPVGVLDFVSVMHAVAALRRRKLARELEEVQFRDCLVPRPCGSLERSVSFGITLSVAHDIQRQRMLEAVERLRAFCGHLWLNATRLNREALHGGSIVRHGGR
eukprot:3199451-Amphidinium_carterae.1